MKTKGAIEFLQEVPPEDIGASMPEYQARRAVLVAHKGLTVEQVAKEEGVSVPVLRKSLGWAVANMDKAITKANL